MKHPLVYGATQVFCLACPAIVRYSLNRHADTMEVEMLQNSERPTSEEEYGEKIKRLRESVE